MMTRKVGRFRGCQLDPGHLPDRLGALDRSRHLVSDGRLPGRQAMEQPPRLRQLTGRKCGATTPGEGAL